MKISDDRRTSVDGVAIETSIDENETWSLDSLHATLKLKSSHFFISSWIKSPEVPWLNFWSCISYHLPTERSISSFLLSPYFSFLMDLMMWDFIQLIKISTGENSGEYSTVWTSVIFNSSAFLLTSFVEWYRAPSQVIMNALFLSPYLMNSSLSSSSMNAVNTALFVLSLLIFQSSSASSLISAITEYLHDGCSWMANPETPLVFHALVGQVNLDTVNSSIWSILNSIIRALSTKFMWLILMICNFRTLDL